MQLLDVATRKTLGNYGASLSEESDPVNLKPYIYTWSRSLNRANFILALSVHTVLKDEQWNIEFDTWDTCRQIYGTLERPIRQLLCTFSLINDDSVGLMQFLWYLAARRQ